MKSYYIQREVDFDLIRDAVCEVCGITHDDFFVSLRRNAADARKMFVGIVFETGSAKLEAIGNYLKGRDHSTVILAKKRHFNLMATDQQYFDLAFKARAIYRETINAQ